jgi:Arc/MetJ family transcription regulator
MRTNIDIDNKLIESALSFSGLKTKREVVDLALKDYVRMSAQRKLLDLRGKMEWVGNLDLLRTSKHADYRPG